MMKRYLLAALTIAIGGLAIGSANALAQDALPEVAVSDGGIVDVPFATVAAGILPSCLAVPTPGVLVQSGKVLTSDGGVAGNIVLTCTVDTTLSAGSPVPLTPLGGALGPTAFSSTAASLSKTALSTGVDTVEVDMEATTTEDVIAAGAYAFTVPVTVTYQ
ncbi:MAG: hypothetical protein WA947_20690 [Phormidesmis sp.]